MDIRARVFRLPGANWYMVRYEAGPRPPLAASGPGAPPGKPARPSLARAEPPAPQLLLPCALLEQVEGLASASPPPLLKVSGETTWYRKKSFLLLQEVITDPGDAQGPPSAPPAEANSPAGAGASAGGESRPKPLTDLAAGSRPAGPPATAGAEAADILQMLAGEKPGKNLGIGAPPPGPPVTVPSVAPQAAQGALSATAGTMVVDRVVQVYPDGKSGWQAIHFVGDNTLSEPPIRLLPCPMLEEAEDLVAASAHRLKFRVSGETTDYKGRKYLLLRKLLVERDLGQL